MLLSYHRGKDCISMRWYVWAITKEVYCFSLVHWRRGYTYRAFAPYEDLCVGKRYQGHGHVIYLLHKSHNSPFSHPTINHFVTEMYTRVHISVSKWCIVGYFTDRGFARWPNKFPQYLWDVITCPCIDTCSWHRSSYVLCPTEAPL